MCWEPNSHNVQNQTGWFHTQQLQFVLQYERLYFPLVLVQLW